MNKTLSTFLVTVFTVIVVAAATLAASEESSGPILKVFVTSAGASNGFTDPSKDNVDTVKDLKDSIRDQKLLALAESPDDAAIVLTVMGRETAHVTAGFLGTAARDRLIRVKFKCGETETELTASAQGGTIGSGGAWGKAAGKIAKQVNDWVKVNGAKLE